MSWFKCWFCHSLAVWHWASHSPSLFFGFLLCVAGIIDNAYLLELMEWLTLKPVLSSVQCTLAVVVIRPSRLEWGHWFSYSVTNSWVYSGFLNPFLNGWQHAKWPYFILFTSFLLRTAGLVQINSGCVCGNCMACFVKERICVCMCVLAHGPADWLLVSPSSLVIKKKMWIFLCYQLAFYSKISLGNLACQWN